MEKIAIIGFGNHVIKNIIPAFNRSSRLTIDCIYVRSPDNYIRQSQIHRVAVKSINEVISNDVNWVYISTPISTHFELAKKYLESGKNVICEKPLTTNADEAKALFAIAEKRGVQLYEVCMYRYHKQYKHLLNTIFQNHGLIKTVKASFTIPHLPKENIRYKKDLGGGAILDVGFYPISLIISLFGEPKNLKSTKYGEFCYEVDLFGMAIFEYDQFYCVAEWGIGLPYVNEVVINTENQVIKYNRIFSKPETFNTACEIREGFEERKLIIGVDDQFLNYFESLLFRKQGLSDQYSPLVIGRYIEFISKK